MKHIITAILSFLMISISCSAQTLPQKEKMTREDKNEKNQAREARINTKNDYAIFRKLITASKEFADEKKKAPKVQADSKMPVKVVIAIDSLDEGDTARTLTGYIVQNVGDNATLMYDITYDRTQKKIITFKKTQEAIDAEKEAQEERAEKAADSKAGPKPAVHKKNKDDDDDDEPEEKPTKRKDEE